MTDIERLEHYIKTLESSLDSHGMSATTKEHMRALIVSLHHDLDELQKKRGTSCDNHSE